MKIEIELTKKNAQLINYLSQNNIDNNFLNYLLTLGFNEYNKLINTHIEKDFINTEIDLYNKHINKKQSLINDIDTIIENKTKNIYNIINDLNVNTLNISTSLQQNHIKGLIGENQIFEFFKIHFPNYFIENVSHIPHNGDLKLYISDINEYVIIEIKNYKNTIDQQQIDKLYYDMEFTGIKLSIFISLKSNIVHINQNLEWKIIDDKIIIFISNSTSELLYMAVYILINLYKMIKENKILNNNQLQLNDYQNLQKNINSILLQKNNISKLKNNVMSIHNNYSNDILNLYNSICVFENDFNYNINKLKSDIELKIENTILLSNKINMTDVINLSNVNTVENIDLSIETVNSIYLQIEEFKHSKAINNIIQIIIADLVNHYIINVVDKKKINISTSSNILICTIKILKTSVNIIFNNEIEIKNVTDKNWNNIYNLIKTSNITIKD